MLPIFALSVIREIIKAAIETSNNFFVVIFSAIFAVAYLLFYLWVNLAVNIKRCHDRNHSGWFLLIALIPIIGTIWVVIELWFLKGIDGDNHYGSDPLR